MGAVLQVVLVVVSSGVRLMTRAPTRAVLMLRKIGRVMAVFLRMGMRMRMDMPMPVCYCANATREEPKAEDEEEDTRGELRPDDNPVLKGSFGCLGALTHDDK